MRDGRRDVRRLRDRHLLQRLWGNLPRLWCAANHHREQPLRLHPDGKRLLWGYSRCVPVRCSSATSITSVPAQARYSGFLARGRLVWGPTRGAGRWHDWLRSVPCFEQQRNDGGRGGLPLRGESHLLGLRPDGPEFVPDRDAILPPVTDLNNAAVDGTTVVAAATSRPTSTRPQAPQYRHSPRLISLPATSLVSSVARSPSAATPSS